MDALIKLVAMTVVLFLGAGACRLVPETGNLRGRSLTSVDGLERVEIPLAGILELRENHQVGSYDELLIPEPTVTYKRGSPQLNSAGRRVFTRLLRESLVEAVVAAGIPIVTESNACAMEIELAAIGMKFDVSDGAHTLARMTMVMQFRDSSSREPLLRYSIKRLVEKSEGGVERNERLKSGLSEAVASLNLGAALRDAGLADDGIRTGCQGTLATLGRAAQRAGQR